MLVAYLIFFVSKMVFEPWSGNLMVWHNFEGICVYSGLCLMMWTLSRYAQAKQIDLHRCLDKKRG